jgi:hypothetical protein
MTRFVLALALLTGIAAAGPAAAQTPRPKPHVTPTTGATSRKIHVTNLTNPGNARNKVGTMSGAGCTSGVTANRSQLAVNPINGQAQAAPIVAVPVGKGAGSVANATTRAQQAQACAHTR